MMVCRDLKTSLKKYAKLVLMNVTIALMCYNLLTNWFYRNKTTSNCPHCHSFQSEFQSTQPDAKIRSTQLNGEMRQTQPNENCRDYRISKQAIEQLKEYWSSPIVVPKYKLIFFWNEKSACTYWKTLFQFIQGINNTEVHNHRNGLTTLKSFDTCEIINLMYNDSWVKAAFVREPRERLLSSYLAKGQHRPVMYELCRVNRTVSFYEFLEIIKHCKNGHWDKQVRIPEHFYEQMMIGELSEISSFTERLFKKIGAWNEKVVAWLQSKEKDKYRRIYRTDAKTKLLQFYNDTKTQDLIFNLFSEDYRVFGFNMTYYKKINITTT